MLFIGIFITMQPALMILKTMGDSLGLTKPTEMFWVTGVLSSIKMPSFFGYMLWSLTCLVPVFLLDTLLFFL